MFTEDMVKRWTKEEDQHICDMADMLLAILIEKQFNAGDALKALEKASDTINWSYRRTVLGQSLNVILAPNESGQCRSEMEAEINRRKL